MKRNMPKISGRTIRNVRLINNAVRHPPRPGQAAWWQALDYPLLAVYINRRKNPYYVELANPPREPSRHIIHNDASTPKWLIEHLCDPNNRRKMMRQATICEPPPNANIQPSYASIPIIPRRIRIKEGYEVVPNGNTWERVHKVKNHDIMLPPDHTKYVTLLNPDFRDGPYIDFQPGPLGTFEVHSTPDNDQLEFPDGKSPRIMVQHSAWGAWMNIYQEAQ
jgi:hypothetical protein